MIGYVVYSQVIKIVQEQERQIDLATALGVDIPDVTQPNERA